MLTTGFFKSALEKCADESFESSKSIPSIEYKTVKIPDKVYKQMKEDHEKNKSKVLKKYYSKPICPRWYKIRKIGECRRVGGTGVTREEMLDNMFNHSLKQDRKVKIKEYTQYEMKRKYRKFFNKSLKNKMKNYIYYEHYSYCVAYKKKSPELFKAQYD